MFEMKNPLNGINGRIDIAEERTLICRQNQNETHRQKEFKKH